ncbi:hypothetical protein Q5P01_008800 [Channa striata]|uniref:Arrestin-C n=1 Tax=Channa striata TaxID=64152 RepID=A0AA88N450_CHASR|nr:hypothetical protein Q5P01_008800 [Channa striata]
MERSQHNIVLKGGVKVERSQFKTNGGSDRHTLIRTHWILSEVTDYSRQQRGLFFIDTTEGTVHFCCKSKIIKTIINMAKVFKKASGSGHITLYLGKRDFVDYVDSVEGVDGVIEIDPSGLKGRKVFVQLACIFQYGSEDVIGLSLTRDIWMQCIQVYPPRGEMATKSPSLESFLKIVGEQGYPFSFQMPTNLPCSVTLHPGPNKTGKSCCVKFEVKGYIANAAVSADGVIDKKDMCRLMIRKIQFVPTDKPRPKVHIIKQFMVTDKPVHLEASLEKEIYYHGDSITVNVKIINETTKVVKKIKIYVEQLTTVVLYSSETYTRTVFFVEFGETINGNSTFKKSFNITPLLSNHKDKLGLAVDGGLKDEETQLASTTLNKEDKEMQGIFVSYIIKINLMVSGGG